MTSGVYLEPGQEPSTDGRCWMLIEADLGGLFYGTGAGLDPTGAEVLYISLPEDDVCLESALAAALDWSERHQVDTIQVQKTPSGSVRKQPIETFAAISIP